MIIDSKYTKTFVSNSLTLEKYNELHNYAIYLRDYKNKLSEFVSNNLMFFLEMSKFEFMKYIRNYFKIKLNSNFDGEAITDVYTFYQTKFSAIVRKLSFNTIDFQGFEHYKRDTKNNKRGEVKRIINKKQTTKLSNCLTYLARYGNDNTIEYIQSQLGTDSKNDEFYNNILRCINKFRI